jgi:hypothetical protein
MEERISELDWLIYYAQQIKKAVSNGHKPITAEVQRLSQIAQSIEREHDEQYQAWCDNLSCTK